MVCTLNVCFTELRWYPTISQAHQIGINTDIFVIACADGSFHIISKPGREEKKIEAHMGVILSIQWNFEGTSLATSGEDGYLKIWSRNGILRSTLVHTNQPIYSLTWSPDSDQILFCCGNKMILKPLQPTLRQIQWEGHEGLVLKVDWNSVNNCILSAGEDCRYKIWDCYGRLLYQSSKEDFIITSIAWCPSGEAFAVGSFNSLLICDKTGWAYTKEKIVAGSVLSIAWSMDGTQIAAAAGDGSVLIAQIVGRKVEWDRFTATLEACNRIHVQGMLNEEIQDMTFQDNIINVSFGFHYLVLVTSTQCWIYSTANWKAPYAFDIKGTIILLKQSPRHILMVDPFKGMQLFTYEGRKVSSPSLQGLRMESLNENTISFSSDTLAIIDCNDHKIVHFLDVTNGKVFGHAFRHTSCILQIDLNQMGNIADRKLVYIDQNHSLYIVTILKRDIVRLGAVVDNVQWNATADIIAAVIYNKLALWYYPNAVYIDQDLLKYLQQKKDCFLEKTADIQSFHGSTCKLRRIDGSSIFVCISPFHLILLDIIKVQQWDQALRLCRYVKECSVWACLAASAVDARELKVAEEAYAALNEMETPLYNAMILQKYSTMFGYE